MRAASPILGLLVVSAWTLAARAQDDPKQQLKDRNLKLVGDVVVHADESKVARMLGDVPKFRKQLIDAGKARAAAERNVALKDAQIQELTQNRITLNAQLPNVNDVDQHNRLVSQLNGMLDKINLLRADETLAEAVKQARNRANLVRESYVEHVLAMRKQYVGVVAEYETLAADESLQELMKTLSATKPVKLGPSRTFTLNDEKIKKIEDTVLSEKISLRKEGGVWMTSVVINGKDPQEFVVDTGAGILSIPGPLAEELDLVPTSDSPTIRLSVADGRTIDAKQVFAKSVRVGKFTVENVECAVMPDTASNAPPLLGQTFLGKFTFQLDADAGELEITKIEGEDGASPRPVRGAPKSKAEPKLKLKDEPDQGR
jgi:clan AA aspartic protease (TIGR02281 family)